MKYARSADTVGKYLKDIGRVSLLTHEQEITLGKQVQQLMNLDAVRIDLAESLGCEPSDTQLAEKVCLSVDMLRQSILAGKQAKRKMVKANLRLVVSIAKKYTGTQLELMDLIQEGNLGLHRGVEKFDPTKGYRFSTYAYWWIRQAITRAIATSSRTIRLPIHIHEKLNKLRKARRRLSQQLGRPATTAELADELSLSNDDVQKLKKCERKPLSLDMRVGKEQTTELGALLEADTVSPEDYTVQKSLSDDLKQLLSVLSERQREVIKMRFGLETGKALTLAVIGDDLGICRERVRQIERNAMKKLRQQGRSIRAYVKAG